MTDAARAVVDAYITASGALDVASLGECFAPGAALHGYLGQVDKRRRGGRHEWLRRLSMTSGRLRQLWGISNCGDLAPGAEGDVAGGPVLGGGEAMAAELEVVVDAGVSEQELLGVAR